MPRGNPRSVKLELRVTPDEKTRLDTAADRRGKKTSELVREQLGALIGHEEAASGASEPRVAVTLPAPVPASLPANPPEPPPGDRLDFVTWLSGRTGMPKALARRAIHAGRVTIDGVEWTSLDVTSIDVAHGQIELDGERV